MNPTMKMPAFRQRSLSRRTVLRGAGVAMGLPMLDAMRPAFAKESAAVVPRRMIAINIDLGFITEDFFPTGAGRHYEPSRYLKLLEDYRESLTVCSGMSHPEVDGGHMAEKSFLTGAPHPVSAGFRNTISLDQFAAQYIGHHTRFPTLSLRVGPQGGLGGGLSFTADGVPIPAENVPSKVYRQLFVQGSPDEVDAQVRSLREGRSLMDGVSEQIRRMSGRVGGPDRARLDQFFSSVRDFEKRLEANEQWEHLPKPDPGVPIPEDNLDPSALVTRVRTMYDLANLAIATDSTRLITISVSQDFNPTVDLPGVELPHHALTHQTGQKDAKEQLRTIETAQMAELARLLGKLQSASEGNDTLLDRTMVMQGSNLGNAGRHDTHNLPILLAGGGFRHGGHLEFDKNNNEPLAKLFVSMLQRLGVPTDQFASGNGRLSGLELGSV